LRKLSRLWRSYLSPDFVKLAVWVEQRRRQLEISSSAADKSGAVVRDHGAFLNSYAPQDEGLYDDATAR